MDAIFLSNRGLLLPTLNIPIWLALALLLFSLILGIVLIRRNSALLRGCLIWASSTVLVFVLASLIMKATTIGVAIGFSDLFMLISTSITQSGQTLELIGILMGCVLLVNFSLHSLSTG